MEVTLKDLNIGLYNYLEIDGVVVHPVDSSSCVINGDYFFEKVHIFLNLNYQLELEIISMLDLF